jgi:ABC-2 type transport system ATP-binding protein
VLDARDAGRTVIFSSHVLSEIEETCDRVAFLRRGRLAHELTISELFQRHRITALPKDSAANTPIIEIPAQLREQVQVTSVERGPHAHLQIDTAGDLAPLLPWLDSLQLKQVRIEPLGLRAVYDAVHDGVEHDALETSAEEVAV